MEIIISVGDVMSNATSTRKVGSTAPSVFEEAKNYNKSRDFARGQNGSLITSLERLHELFNDKEFVKSLENTAHYNKKGYVWFWTDIQGTDLNGYYRRNPSGKALEEMFQFIAKGWLTVRKMRDKKEIKEDEISYFFKCKRALSVSVKGPGWWRLSVGAVKTVGAAAPAVVVEQAQAPSKPVA